MCLSFICYLRLSSETDSLSIRLTKKKFSKIIKYLTGSDMTIWTYSLQTFLNENKAETFFGRTKKKLLSLQVSLYKLLMNWKYERVDIFIHVTKLIFLVADKGSCPTIIIMAKPHPRSTSFLSGMNNWNKKVERDENRKKMKTENINF